MRPRAGRAAARLLLASASACGGGSGAPVSASAGVTGPAAPAEVPAGRSLRVGLTEWAVHIPATEVPGGEVTLTVLNAGAAPHDLAVEGRAGSWRTPHLATGESITLTVRAEPGELLRLWCTIAGHASSGMESTLPVAG